MWQFQLTETVSLFVQFVYSLCTPGLNVLECLGLKIGDECGAVGLDVDEGLCAPDDINGTVCQKL